MKITKTRLKQIIKEELEEYKARLAPEEQSQQAVQKAVIFLNKLETSRPDVLERIIKHVQDGDYGNAIRRLEGLPAPGSKFRPEPGSEERRMLDRAVEMLDAMYERGEVKQ